LFYVSFNRFQVALQYLDEGRPGFAMDTLKQAIASYPKYADFWVCEVAFTFSEIKVQQPWRT